jgi:hypothetical protein
MSVEKQIGAFSFNPVSRAKRLKRDAPAGVLVLEAA